MIKFELMSENLELIGNYISKNNGQKYVTDLCNGGYSGRLK
jgi:hypothetical protein